MDMQGNRSLAVTQQQAWDALNDPEVLKACVPGCDRMELTGENQYGVGMTVKIGPVSAKFSGRIQLSDIVPPESYTIAFDGQGGAAGFGKGQSKVTLAPEGEGCALHYTVNAQVGGKVAQLGQRLIDGAAKSMAEDFFKRFDQEMQKRHPEAYAARDAAAAASAAPPPDADGALPIAMGAAALEATGPAAEVASVVSPAASTSPVADEPESGGIPPWVWAAGLVVVVAAVWLLRH